MVTNVTSFSRSGLSDFVTQRITAVIIALYTLWVLGFFIANPNVTHETLAAFFGAFWMKVFSTLALLSTVAHAWIGMWTVGTDYIRGHYFGQHSTAIRIVYQLVCMAVLFLYVVLGLQIFWRV